jgi:hypothetical protein
METDTPVQALRLAAAQVHELLDLDHAVQRLGQVAALRKDWSQRRVPAGARTSAAC